MHVAMNPELAQVFCDPIAPNPNMIDPDVTEVRDMRFHTILLVHKRNAVLRVPNHVS